MYKRQTISGTKPKVYDIEIEKVNLNDHSPTKNMVVKITDPELLEATGGIVQGMSGSPIIQNGKLVGAVTQDVYKRQIKDNAVIHVKNFFILWSPFK